MMILTLGGKEAVSHCEETGFLPPQRRSFGHEAGDHFARPPLGRGRLRLRRRPKGARPKSPQERSPLRRRRLEAGPGRVRLPRRPDAQRGRAGRRLRRLRRRPGPASPLRAEQVNERRKVLDAGQENDVVSGMPARQLRRRRSSTPLRFRASFLLFLSATIPSLLGLRALSQKAMKCYRRLVCIIDPGGESEGEGIEFSGCFPLFGLSGYRVFVFRLSAECLS